MTIAQYLNVFIAVQLEKKTPITISFVFCLHPAPIIECLPVNQALFQVLGIQL